MSESRPGPRLAICQAPKNPLFMRVLETYGNSYKEWDEDEEGKDDHSALSFSHMHASKLPRASDNMSREHLSQVRNIILPPFRSSP
jgi:hypothetical protein